MRIQENETYEEWANRVQQYECEQALAQIRKGKDSEVVLERMSKNIVNKMLHPILTELNVQKVDLEQQAKSKQHYEEYYLKKVPRASDHVSE